MNERSPPDFYSGAQVSCGRCLHWGKMTVSSNTGTHVVDGPTAVPHEGVIVRTCGKDRRHALVVNGIGWLRGSDYCSKWKKNRD